MSTRVWKSVLHVLFNILCPQTLRYEGRNFFEVPRALVKSKTDLKKLALVAKYVFTCSLKKLLIIHFVFNDISFDEYGEIGTRVCQRNKFYSITALNFNAATSDYHEFDSEVREFVKDAHRQHSDFFIKRSFLTVFSWLTYSSFISVGTFRFPSYFSYKFLQ